MTDPGASGIPMAFIKDGQVLFLSVFFWPKSVIRKNIYLWVHTY